MSDMIPGRTLGSVTRALLVLSLVAVLTAAALIRPMSADAQPRTNAAAVAVAKQVVSDIGGGKTHLLYGLLVAVQRGKVTYAQFARCATYVGHGQRAVQAGAVVREPLAVYGYASKQQGALVPLKVTFASGRVMRGNAALVYRNSAWHWFLSKSQLIACD